MFLVLGLAGLYELATAEEEVVFDTNFIPLITGIFIGLAILFYGWSYLVWRFYKYEFREHEFRKEHGVINKKYTSIPYRRIQNVDVDRNLLERMMGLSELKIQTAGERLGSEGRIPGLEKEKAEEVRGELLSIARQGKDDGLGGGV